MTVTHHCQGIKQGGTKPADVHPGFEFVNVMAKCVGSVVMELLCT